MKMIEKPVAAWVCANMKRLREKRGLSQGALAKMLGTTQSYVSGLEGSGGERAPSLPMLAKIAAALRVEPGELVKRVRS